MFIKKLTILAVIFFTSLGCSGQKDGLAIEGKVDNPAGKQIILQKYTADNIKDVATVELKSNNSYSFPATNLIPGFYRLNFFDTQFVNLILNEDNVTVNVDGSSAHGNYEIKGSTEMDQVKSVQDLMEQFQEELTQLNAEYGDGLSGQNPAIMEKAFAKFTELQEKYSGKIKHKIRDMGNSMAVLQAVAYLDPDQDLDFIDSVVTQLATAMPNLDEAKQIKAELAEMKRFAIGSEAPDFTLTDDSGKNVSLSSFKGKYLLLDFWAAWCRPCRIENPHIVEAYKKYNSKGFDVFGVSLDQNESQWHQAIKQDGLLWSQVRDVNNEVATLYKVSAIPLSFLLDKDGKIIAKNLRGSALEEKLEKIFE
jgi:peroxiredoxin